MADADLNAIIIDYFDKGYTYKEIAGGCCLSHGKVVSVRQVKYILKKLDKRRQINEVNPENTLENIIPILLRETEGSASCLGYRSMWKLLKCKYNLNVRRDTVMQCLRYIDSEGVELRRKRRLHRRKYKTPGPNYIWHIDG